jgi:hypothetical protein
MSPQSENIDNINKQTQKKTFATAQEIMSKAELLGSRPLIEHAQM